VVLKWVDVDANGDLDPQAVIDAIGPRTKLVAITHMSNVLGTVVDLKPIIDAAHAKGVAVLVDGSQAAVHMPVELDALGADFYAITGHKLYGPSGSGAIHIKKDRMAEMRPFMGGGDMIREVHRDVVTWNDPPMKFEAGTPGIVQQIGLGVALDYMMGVGMENIAAHEARLTDYARAQLDGLNWLNVQGQSASKGAIFSFTIEGAGHHCAQPLMEHMGVSATCRASFGMYNTEAEVDALVDALQLCHELFA
jgi:cysteine desulfurase/selenocysteine lyase